MAGNATPSVNSVKPDYLKRAFQVLSHVKRNIATAGANCQHGLLMASRLIINCQCGQPLQVSAAQGGQTAQCPACGNLIQIPQQAAPPVASPALSQRHPQPQTGGMRPPSMASSGGGKAGWIIGGVLGGVALLVGIIVLISGGSGEGEGSTGNNPGTGSPGGAGNQSNVAGMRDWPESVTQIKNGVLPANPTNRHEAAEAALPIEIRGKVFGVPVIGDAPIAAVPARLEITSDKAFDIYDLKNGNRISTIPSNKGDGEILDISPAGDKIAVTDNGIVSVYDLKTAQLLKEFSPPDMGKGIGREIEVGKFIGKNDFVLFDNGPGLLGLWDMDEEEYQWAYQVPGYGNRRAAVGPGREYVYLNAEGKLIVLEVDSGDIIGELPATAAFKESRYHQFKEVRLSPNGALMAASFGSVGTNVPVAVWNLKEGTLVGDYVLSKKLAAVLDDRYLLYGDYSSYWIRDMEEERDAWMIRVKGDPSAFTTRGASPWFVSSYHTGSVDQNYLASSEVDVAQILSNAKPPSEPPLLDKGGKVSVSISGSKPSGDSGFISRVTEIITKSLQSKGFVVESGQPVRCQVTFTVNKTGESREYFEGDSGSKSIKIPEKHIEVVAVISDSSGKAYWRSSRKAYQRSFIPGDAKGGPQAYLDEQQWQSAEEIVGKVRFPGRVWTKHVMGSSTLNKDGFLD